MWTMFSENFQPEKLFPEDYREKKREKLERKCWSFDDRTLNIRIGLDFESIGFNPINSIEFQFGADDH